ncbi:MAG: type II toxin-antitoxin system VapC family toxin [Chloroflexota bacterium]|nr:type II toxin-antitoxin system VapC family toxin [Chloroflexota bacterium]MDE2895834.1 type II toxin-antitoxin system VapC family toxin [Chloroflexota bacterium]
MADVVLDASAILAVLRKEAGADRVRRALGEGAIVSAANHAEVISKLIAYGMPHDLILPKLAALGYEVVPVPEADATTAGFLFGEEKANRLSLGDRCCLALAIRLSALVLTGDRPWIEAELDSIAKIELIR